MHHWTFAEVAESSMAIWESFVLWFFRSKIKDSFASEENRQVLLARCSGATCCKPPCQTQPNPFNDPKPYYQNLWHYWILLVWKDMKKHLLFFMLCARCWVATCDGFQQRLENFRICPESCYFCPFFARKLRSVLKTEKRREARLFH